MKDALEELREMSSKTQKKLDEFFEKNGNQQQYRETFLADINKSSAMCFKKTRCIVTDNYFLYYGVMGPFSKSGGSEIIPLNRVTNIYRSNIIQNGQGRFEYHFSCFDLVFELDGDENRRLYCCRELRTNNLQDIYKDEIARRL